MDIDKATGSISGASYLPHKLLGQMFDRRANTLVSLDELEDLDAWRIERDEQRQDETDEWLYAFYDCLSPVLAAQFTHLREKAAEQFGTLRTIAAEVDRDIGAPNRREIEEVAVAMAWQPVARAVTLALLDYLISQGDEPQLLTAATLAKCAFEADRARTSKLAAMSEADCYIAVGVAAAELSRSNVPVALRYQRRYLTLQGMPGLGLYALCTEQEPAALFAFGTVVSEPRLFETDATKERYVYVLGGEHVKATALAQSTRWDGAATKGSLSFVAARQPVKKLSFHVGGPIAASANMPAERLPGGEDIVFCADTPLKFHRLGDAFVLEPEA